jgi:NAD/NADP transhydrogenase alpha subunit
MTLGVPRESARGERRVAQTPGSVAALVKSGFKLAVEAGAGAAAAFRDADYAAAGVSGEAGVGRESGGC